VEAIQSRWDAGFCGHRLEVVEVFDGLHQRVFHVSDMRNLRSGQGYLDEAIGE
jgi:hypothetical protein